MTVIYAGIGARKTPDGILQTMTKFAEVAGRRGWMLRSGGAAGADQAFERGARKKEIFLPSGDIPDEAFRLAAQHHQTGKLAQIGRSQLTPGTAKSCWARTLATR